MAGKMVCTGAKSESDSRLAARKFSRTLQKLGFEDAKFQDFKVQNIVASCDVLFPIRLEGLHYKHGLFCSYEPELFPGLIYRMKKPKVVLLIFASGKVVLTGATNRTQIYQAFEAIYPALSEYCKGTRSQSTKPGLVNEQDAPPQPETKPDIHAGELNPPTTPGAQVIKTECIYTQALSHTTPLDHYCKQEDKIDMQPFSWAPTSPSYVLPFTPGYGGIPPPTPGYSLLQDHLLDFPSLP